MWTAIQPLRSKYTYDLVAALSILFVYYGFCVRSTPSVKWFGISFVAVVVGYCFGYLARQAGTLLCAAVLLKVLIDGWLGSRDGLSGAYEVISAWQLAVAAVGLLLSLGCWDLDSISRVRPASVTCLAAASILGPFSESEYPYVSWNGSGQLLLVTVLFFSVSILADRIHFSRNVRLGIAFVEPFALAALLMALKHETDATVLPVFRRIDMFVLYSAVPAFVSMIASVGGHALRVTLTDVKAESQEPNT